MEATATMGGTRCRREGADTAICHVAGLWANKREWNGCRYRDAGEGFFGGTLVGRWLTIEWGDGNTCAREKGRATCREKSCSKMRHRWYVLVIVKRDFHGLRWPELKRSRGLTGAHEEVGMCVTSEKRERLREQSVKKSRGKERLVELGSQGV